MSAVVKRQYGWRMPTPEDIKKYEHEHPIKMCAVRGTHNLYPKIDLRDWMPPVYNQENLGSCHDDQTEILTENGWKFFKDIFKDLPDEKVATVNPNTLKIFYEKPARLIKLRYFGDMITCKTKFLDFCVTPDHKMLIKKQAGENFSFIDAKELSKNNFLVLNVKDNVNITDEYIKIQPKDIVIERYNDYVYCAEVPTYHTLVTRRNNKILISGNCTANALSALYEYYEIKQKEDCEFTPSRLWIYYWERVFEGTINEDSGAIVATGVKVIKSMGVCPEKIPKVNPHKITNEVCWPYDVSKFTLHPPAKSILFARNHKAINAYRIVQSLTQMKQQLQDGHPIVFGFMVCESFEGADVAKDGLMHMPYTDKPDSIIGGHAVIICGYDDTKQVYDQTGAFLVRNSWGEEWGEKGYFWMPYTFALDANMCSDFWTMQSCLDKY